MKTVRAKTHQEVLKPFLRDLGFRRGYEEELEKLRIVDTLIQLRERQGLTQIGLARRMGVSQPFIAKLESGETHNFSLETLLKLALALNSELEVRFHPKQAKAA